jgi:hypothetical protein
VAAFIASQRDASRVKSVRQRLVVAFGYQEDEIRACSSSMTASRDAAVPLLLCIPSKARCAAQ